MREKRLLCAVTFHARHRVANVTMILRSQGYFLYFSCNCSFRKQAELRAFRGSWLLVAPSTRFWRLSSCRSLGGGRSALPPAPAAGISPSVFSTLGIHSARFHVTVFMLNIKQMLRGSADLELHNDMSCFLLRACFNKCTYADRHRCTGVAVLISGKIRIETACKIPLIKVHLLIHR